MAELLDIEAKLDTSLVQGLLNLLSKTAGLLNLDKAIHTLEQSMKKLAAQLDIAAKQAALGGLGGGLGHSKATNWLGGEKFSGGRAIRGLGAYMIGQTLLEIGEASGSDTLKTAGKYAGGIARGAAVGGLVGGPFGAVAGAGLGALLTALQDATAAVEDFRKALSNFTAKYESQNKAALDLLLKYLDSLFKAYAEKTTDRNWLNLALGDKQSMSDLARQREKAAADRLEAFQKSDEHANIGKLLERANLQDVINTENLNQDNWLERLKDRLAGNDVVLSKDQQRSILSSLKQQKNLMEELKAASADVARADELREVVQKRIEELDKEAAKTAKEAAKEAAKAAEKKAAEAEKEARAQEKIAKFRELVKGGIGTDIRSEQHRQRLEAINNGFGESQASIKGNAFIVADQLQQARQQYSSTLQEAMDSDAPEQFIDKLNDMKVTISELEDVLEAWQSKIEEQIAIDISELLSKSMAAVGGLNSLEQSGYFGVGGRDMTIENLVEKILQYTRQITNNTQKEQDVSGTTGTYDT